MAGASNLEGEATTAAALDDAVYVVQPLFMDDEPPMILRVVP